MAADGNRDAGENQLLPAKFSSTVFDAPESFFSPSESLSATLVDAMAALFERTAARHPAHCSLRKLHREGFDDEQLWAQLQLNNGSILRAMKREVKHLVQDADNVNLPAPRRERAQDGSESESETESQGAGEDSDEDEEEEEEEDEEEEEEDEEEEEEQEQGARDGDRESHDEEGSAWDRGGAGEGKEGNEEEEEEAGVVPSDGFFDWRDMEREADLDDQGMELDAEGRLDEDGNEVLSEADSNPEGEGEEDEEDDAIDDAMELGDVGKKRGARYDDIFAPPSRGSKRKTSEDTGEGEGEGADGALANSRFAQSQQALQDTIGELEDESLAPKPWQLKGETSARQRPQNSLLEAEAETLEFERAVAPAPEVTLERSVALEEIIKQRIVDENFDDVVRLPSAAEQAQARLNATRELADVSMERDSRGLGDVYADEYERRMLGHNKDDGRQKERAEIESMFAELSDKLDALSNFHFTPTPVRRDELAVQPAVPAIAMEEAVPMAVSTASLQTPEEVFAAGRGESAVGDDAKTGGQGKGKGKTRGKGKAKGAGSAAEGGLVGASELTQEERKRKRRAQKRANRKAARQEEQDEKLASRLNPGLGNKYAKAKLKEELARARNVTRGTVSSGGGSQYTDSSKFFARLQEQVRIEGTEGASKSAKKSGGRGKSSAAMKL